MDDEELGRERIRTLNEDQLAMLALLGGDPETVPRMSLSFYYEPEPQEGVSLLRPDARVHVHDCPVVEWRGHHMRIDPDGSALVIEWPPMPRRDPKSPKPSLRLIKGG